MKPAYYITALLALFAIQQGASQNYYIEKWREVEQFELEDKIEDATKIVDEIYKHARRKKDEAQYIKVFLFKSKYQLVNKEEAQYKIIAQLDEMIQKATFPNRNIYNGIRAKLLDDYARSNQWNIRNRTAGENNNTDFKTWDATRYYREIHNGYQASLIQPEKLAKVPLSDYSAIIGAMAPARILRPTLLDILSHQALDFYKSEYFYLTKPKEEFSITKENAFLNTADLLKLNRPAGDTIFSKYDVLQQYAQLESRHLKLKNVAAFIHVFTDRMGYALNQVGTRTVYKDYEDQLNGLITTYDKNPAVTEAYYYLAQYYLTLSNSADKEEKLSYRQQSIKRAKQAKELYPDSYGAVKCEQLLQQIHQPNLNLQVENLIIPGRPHRGVINYTNVDKVDLYYIKVAMDETLREFQFTDSLHQVFIDKSVQNQSVKHQRSITLPQAYDTFNHSYEYMTPALEKGRYVIIAQAHVATTKATYARTFITVTNLTLFKKDSENTTELLVKDRTTGQAVKQAKVDVSSNKKNRNYRTDKDGKLSIPLLKNSRSQDVIISNNGDSLATNIYAYYRNPRVTDNELSLDLKTFIYLDRAIYRPGQTVYFKSILLKKKGKESGVVAGQLLDVYAQDVNGNEIFKTSLNTNEYGSINGSFEIPKEVLTGVFTLHIDQPDKETQFTDSVNNWHNGQIDFKVEEYKRPTFDVDFKETTATYKLGDSVTVNGFAKAFLGSNITNGTVNYKVYRSFNYSRWHYGYYDRDEKVVEQAATITDSKGEFHIKFLAEKDTSADSKYKPIYSYKIEAEVTDLNGETRTATTRIKVGTNSIQINTQLPSQFTVENNSIKAGVQNLNGQFVNGKLIIELRIKPQASHVLIPSGLPKAEFQELETQAYRSMFPYAELREDELETDWEKAPIIYRKEITTDSLTTVQLPITKNWANGSYFVYVRAVEPDQSFENEDDVVDSRIEKTLWANLEQSLQPEIISSNSEYTPDAAVFNLYTSMIGGVYATLSIWTDKEMIDEKLIYLKQGKTELKYPWSQINGKNISMLLQVQKENDFVSSKTVTVNKPIITDNQYQIKTATFRNKLEPGVEEKWSFTIKDDNQIPMQAEVLASMYDKSLDEFATASWSAPFIKDYEFNFSPILYTSVSYKNLQSLYVQFPRISTYYTPLKYDSFNFFGLSFNNFSRSYKNYKYQIKRKLKELEPKKGFITGHVTDGIGEPLLGATVIIKGSSNVTTTDFDGIYSLKADPEDTLVFSFAGYSPQEIVVGNSKILSIVMEESLDAVVITSYSSESRQDFTSAILMESDDDGAIMNTPTGLDIMSSKQSHEVLIRGRASGSSDKEPLYIVDGITVSAVDFRNINNNDITEMAVLKGDAATAVYGNSGANGVIIISTKKGVSANDLVLQEMALNNVVARKNLQETAFFLPDLRTDENGNFKFSFTTPEALTQWKLRLLAHDKKGKSAQMEQLVVTQKELSIVPNAPRFLRETDTIRFSTKIANLSDAAMDGTARLQLFDAMTMKAIDAELGNVNNTRDFTILEGGNTSVNWIFRIPLGTQAVTYRVVAAAGTFSDGEENTLPVLTNRMLVNESRALWVRAGATQTAVMDNLLNSDSGTIAHHQMVFEYTSNPSWYAIKSLPYLMEFEHECAEQTFSRYYANSMAHHILTSNPKVKTVFDSWAQNGTNVSPLEKNEELKTVLLSHTPWLRDAQTEAQKQQRLATLFDLARTAQEKKKTLAKLERMQGDSGGFPWFKGGDTNEYITRHIAAGIGHIKQLGVKNEDTPQTDRIYKNAINALDAAWKKRFNKYLETHKTLEDYSYGNDYWHYQYARSFEIDKSDEDKTLIAGVECAFAKAENEYTSQPLYMKLLMAITLNRSAKTKLATTIMEGLKQTAVKSDENGMYWKENRNSWNWYSSDIETQALAIEAFQEITADLKSVEELKIWLLKNKRTNQWKSTKATADATYALLLQGGKWLDVQENNKITWGNKPLPADLMKAAEKEAGTGYFKISIPGAQVSKEMATVTVKNKSDVTGYGALYWQYFENLDKIVVDDDLPLSVQKKLFKKIMTDSGEKLQEITAQDPLKIGDLITVRLIIKTNADMDFVHLKDMRASGFEPVDVISEYKWQDGLGYYQSTKDVATHFFFDQMNKGTYVFEYDVRANNAGQFSNGITQLECMYAPEFSSHSEGMRVRIEE